MTPMARAMITDLKRRKSRLTVDVLQRRSNFAAAIDLSIAYSATIGGMATITGTVGYLKSVASNIVSTIEIICTSYFSLLKGSNLALQGTMKTLFGSAGEISFMSWLFFFLKFH